MSTMVGRLVGEYRLEMPIATGSLGSVFRARHVREDRPVALKIINPGITSDAGFRDRFRREIGAAATLRHEHILSVLYVGEHAGQFYYVMEWVNGASLRALLQRADRPVSLVRGVDFVRQAAEGLAFAHAKGVLHRDVKPENLMVDRGPDGVDRIKVADFGMTRLVETGATLGNAVVGTPAYMSPEECRGSAVDARSDLYSLGVVLYEATTGYQPFQVKSLGDAVVKHVSTPPPSPRSINEEFPPELEAVILRLLAKRPEERYQSANEVAGALSGVLPMLRDQRKPVVMMRDDQAPRPIAPPPPSGPAKGPIRVMMGDARPPATPTPPAPARGDGPPRIRVSMNDAPAAPPMGASAPPNAPGAPPGGRIKVNIPTARPKTELKPPDPQQDGPRDSKRIKVLLQQQQINVTPGMQVVVQVTLVNAGKTVDHFHVAVEGIPESWVRGPAEDPRILPDGRAPVALSINAPRSPESRAAEYAVVVRAQSRENPMESGFATATVIVAPFSNTTVALAPTRRRAWRRAAYGVTMRNDGNAAAAYRLKAADEEQVLDYRFAEERVQVPPGETVSVRLKAEAPIRWIGNSDTRSFTVRADREEGLGAREEPRTALGQFVHRPIIPIWLVPLAIAVALVLMFLIPQWTTILLEVAPKNPTAALGGTVQLLAKVTNKKGEVRPDKIVTWESGNENIATVDSTGLVTGKAEGTATITARSGKTIRTVDVAVVPARVAKVTLVPAQLRMRIGDSRQIRATAADASGGVLQRDFMWLSSDPTVATVGGNGKVVAKGPGSASITVQTEGKSATAEVTVAAAAGGGPSEDCVAYDPAQLKVARDPTGWLVTDGKATLATMESESDARRVMAVAQRYKQRCYLGRFNTRPNRSLYIVDYWKEPTGLQTQIAAEECIPPYVPASLEIAQVEQSGFVLRDRTTKKVVLWTDTQADATKAWEVAKGYTRMCVIGQNNRQANKRDYTVWYWK